MWRLSPGCFHQRYQIWKRLGDVQYFWIGRQLNYLTVIKQLRFSEILFSSPAYFAYFAQFAKMKILELCMCRIVHYAKLLQSLTWAVQQLELLMLVIFLSMTSKLTKHNDRTLSQANWANYLFCRLKVFWKTSNETRLQKNKTLLYLPQHCK